MTDKELKKIILKEVKSILNEQVAVEVEYHSVADTCVELETILRKAITTHNDTQRQAFLEKAYQSVVYIHQQVNQGWSQKEAQKRAAQQGKPATTQTAKQPTATTQKRFTTQQTMAPNTQQPTTARSPTTRPQI